MLPKVGYNQRRQPVENKLLFNAPCSKTAGELLFLESVTMRFRFL